MSSVVLVTNVSNVAGVYVAGDEIDLTPEEAADYIARDLAAAAPPAGDALASGMRRGAPERATLPRAHGR